MNEKQKALAARLLQMAADEFSNHGCNDLSKGTFKDWTQEEKAEFIKDAGLDGYGNISLSTTNKMKQREIKFRFWHERKNKMCFGPTDDNDSPSWVLALCHNQSEIPLMQFTGLLDKNGKEIYEGDIVTCQTNNKFEYPHKGEVIYLDHICGFGITTEPIVNEHTGNEEPAFTYFNYNTNFEIIGNIYQTPDLLK